MISPILAYNSEVWGAYTKSDLKSWDSFQIEKTHLQFCKRYLNASSKAPNVACRADLERFPLIIAINQISSYRIIALLLNLYKNYLICNFIIKPIVTQSVYDQLYVNFIVVQL